MRRTVSLIFTLAVLISFMSHYPLIASAPSHAASIAPDLFGSAERVKELGQSNWYQSFVPEPVAPIKKAAAVKAGDTAKTPADDSQPAAAPQQNAVLHSDIDSKSLAQLTAVHDVDLRFLAHEQRRDQQGNYCDPTFVGEALTFSQSVGSTLDELLNQIHNRFGINFVLGPKVGRLPINVKSEDTPWTTILRSQLFVLGVGATCVDNRTIQLIKNDDVTALEKAEHESAKVETHYIKLKYLQPSSSENKNIAGQSSSSSSSSSGGQGGAGGSGGCQQNQGGAGGGGGGQQQNIPQRCKFERLMIEIGQILGISGNQGAVTTFGQGPNQQNGQEPIYTGGYGSPYKPYVGQVPGRNMLVVRGTKRQLDEVSELIKHADIPPFQVVIRGLVYTANEDKLRDIGVQTTITARTGDNRTSGGIFGQSVGGLGTLFDFSTVIGTVDFNVQANALQQNGVISIKSRPFATVLDGITTDLTVGRQVPVIIQAANNIGGSPGTLQILQAANLLSVTPHVIDDDQGNPTAVNLELQLESNDVDTSVLSQGVPAVSVRSIQSNFILNQEQTAILGGFTVDSDNKTVTKTPGLGDIPILGELFKRRVRSNQINRLYFAISVSVIPYGGVIEPVTVPGATTAPPSITPKMEERGKEPKAVAPPKGP